MLTTFLWGEYHWGRPPGISFSSVVLEASVLLLSECGPGKAQFALPSAGIRCLYPQSCPVAYKWTVVHMSWPPNNGSPASKQRMSKWVVEAISLAYESAGQPPPMAVRSHSTRSMAASKALISGVALQEVCDAAGCSSPHTFVRFYSWTWTLPQVPKCSRPSAAHKIHTGQALVAMVMLYWCSQSVFYAMEFPWKGSFGYDCKLGSLKRERMLRSRPYLLRACERLAQTFKLVTASFGQVYSLLVCDVTCSDVPITPWIDYTCASRLITQSIPKACFTVETKRFPFLLVFYANSIHIYLYSTFHNTYRFKTSFTEN